MSERDSYVRKIAHAITVARQLVSEDYDPLPLARFIVDLYALAPVNRGYSSLMARHFITHDDVTPERAAEELIDEGAYQQGG